MERAGRSPRSGRCRPRLAGLPLAIAVIAAACSAGDVDVGGGTGEDADGSRPTAGAADPATAEEVAQVHALCDGVVDLHSDIIDTINTMSSAEVSATPEARAQLLADALGDAIALVEQAPVPEQPPGLTHGMADRRIDVLEEMALELEGFRSANQQVPQDQRRQAVNRVFLLAEKLMSETEPRVGPDTRPAIIEAARAYENCRFVIQLPPPDGT